MRKYGYCFLSNLLVFASLMCLAGCTTDFVSPNNPYDYSLLKIRQKDLNETLPGLEKEYYMSETTGDRRTVIREQIVYNLLELDDEYYRKWVSDFYGRGQTFSLFVVFAVFLLSAVFAVF